MTETRLHAALRKVAADLSESGASGIEPEIVAAAEPLELVEGLVIRIATIPHLIATKVLSRDDAQRPQDRMDLLALMKAAREEDVSMARNALLTIHARGFHRGKDLMAELERLLS